MKLTVLQYITPSRLGGAEEVFLRLVEDQRARGHRVLVVTKRDTPLRPLLEKSGVECHAWLTRGKIDPRTLAKLCRIVRHEHVDIIHTHLTTASWLGSLTGKLTRTPVLAHVHAADSKTWFQRADYLIAVSQGVKRHLMGQGIAAKRIPVVYYGLDIAKYPEPLSAQECKAKLGIPPSALTVGVTASLQERKGHRYLLEALKQVEGEMGPIWAIFAGEGPEQANLEALTCELGMTERVKILGFRKNVREVVSAFDVFCLPSRKEGLSIAVMEAMALQRPVVATDIAGMDEIVHNEKTGLLVPPFETAPLAAALLRLFKDENLRKQLGENGRLMVEQDFDQKVCLGTLERLQQNVVSMWRRGKRFEVRDDNLRDSGDNDNDKTDRGTMSGIAQSTAEGTGTA
jgi:glycosyltransferase involved in cell wall biosynthesis